MRAVKAGAKMEPPLLGSEFAPSKWNEDLRLLTCKAERSHHACLTIAAAAKAQIARYSAWFGGTYLGAHPCVCFNGHPPAGVVGH